MAFDVNDLTNYVIQDTQPVLTKALYGGETATLLAGAGQILPGIKTEQELNILGSSIFFQANGCEPTSSGTTAFTKRTLKVGDIQVYETLCPKTLKQKWMQTIMSPGSKGDNNLVLADVIGNQKAEAIAQELEIDLWQGTIASNQFDGFNTILTALGFGGAGDPIEGNPTTGGGWTKLTSLTQANIDDAIAKMVSSAPAAVLKRQDAFIAMGVDTFLLYKADLVAANLFHYNPELNSQWETFDPISGIRVYALPGLSGTNKIHLSYWANYFIGTDMLDENELFEFLPDLPKKVVHFNCEFKYGVQVAFPDQIVYFTL